MLSAQITPSMSSTKPAANGKAQANAVTLLAYGAFQLIKGLEEPVHLVLRYANACVLNLEEDLAHFAFDRFR